MVGINDREQVVLKLHSAMLAELQKANLVENVGNGDWCALMYFMGYQIVVDDDCPDWEFGRKPAVRV